MPRVHPCQRCGENLEVGSMCTVQLHGAQPSGHWHFVCTPDAVFQMAAGGGPPVGRLEPADRVRTL